MKRLLLFLLCAAPVVAADFTTGQAARAVIGQETFTSQDPNSSSVIVGGVSGLAYAANTLFVADSNFVGAAPSNHRVLLFQNLSSMLPNPTDELTYNRKCPVCVGQATVVLGQPDFNTTTENFAATPNALRLPTAVASDGVHLVVADTNHNRVLIWNRIPTINDAAADVVVGQPNFTSVTIPPNNTPTAASMRGPQGVWLQNGKLYVADTQNNRVLIFNHIPTSNGASADVVLGQPNLTTAVQPDLTQQKTDATASNLLTPVSVSSDGLRLFVTDLGYNRVLIWNSIPTANAAPADVAVGQPDFVSSLANNAFTTDSSSVEHPVLCTVSNGTDSNSNPTYPTSCNATLNFPRFALAAGNRLFVADGGNDRVLVFNQIPNQNGALADYIIGQIGGSINQASDAADSLRTPMSLAWDGINLYVSDAYNRRVTVYSIGENGIPYTGVRNAASLQIIATGQVTIGGTIKADDVVTITISGTDYTYKVLAPDSIASVVTAVTNAINSSNGGAGDPNALAMADTTTSQVLLFAKQEGTAGNSITYSAKVSTSAQITATAGGANLTGGGDAAKIAPGTVVSLQGTDLSFNNASADTTKPQLPTKLGGTEVYFNGIRAPLFYVSPTQVNAQIPWEVQDTTSINAYVRSERGDGLVVATTPVAVTIVTANPGIYAQPGTSPPVGVMLHGSSYAIGIVSVDGTANAGDVATVTIADRGYSYTVQSGDTLDSIRDNLIALINQDPQVTAKAAGVFDRIVLSARVEGPDGNSITFGASSASGAQVIMTAFGSQLCCANIANAPVTADNPAIAGEVVIIYATGLGLPVLTDANKSFITTGVPYPAGAPETAPQSSLSSIAGGRTADVLSATLKPGSVGLYEVVLHLNSGMSTDPLTSLTIAQDVYVSNVVRFPVLNPAPGQ